MLGGTKDFVTNPRSVREYTSQPESRCTDKPRPAVHSVDLILRSTEESGTLLPDIKDILQRFLVGDDSHSAGEG
jgi:hypothetical protein